MALPAALHDAREIPTRPASPFASWTAPAERQRPDLSQCDLSQCDLSQCDLSGFRPHERPASY